MLNKNLAYKRIFLNFCCFYFAVFNTIMNGVIILYTKCTKQEIY